MIDENGDGRIEYNEFLSAAKSAMEDESLAVNRGSVAVREVLQKVSEYMRKNRVRGDPDAIASSSCCLSGQCAPSRVDDLMLLLPAQTSLRDLFNRFDSGRAGTLEPKEVMSLFRWGAGALYALVPQQPPTLMFSP